MKRSISFILASIMVLSLLSGVLVTGVAASASDLTFELNESGKSYSITECNKEATGKIVIPSVYKKLPVTKIADYCFYSCKNITSVKIPDSVKSIGFEAFGYCLKLASISVDSENAYYYSSNGILYDRKRDALVKCPGGKNGKVVVSDGVVAINDQAFENCAEISSITLPDSVSKIGIRAFQMCSAKKINIPEKVKKIEYRTFASSGIESLVIPKNIKIIDRYAFAWSNALKKIKFVEGSLKTIETSAFIDCENLKDIYIPEGLIVNIEDNVFSGTGYAKDKANWSKGILYLNNRIIATDPSKLKGEVVIKEGIIHVATRAFEGCDKITSVVIPESMVAIGGYSFWCENLKKVKIKSDNLIMQASSNIGVYAGPFDWSGIYNDDSNWKNDVLYIDGYLVDTRYNENDKKYTIKPGTRGIATRAFEGFKKLKKITVPASVNNIDDLAIGYIRDDGNYSVKLDDLTIYGVKGSVAEKYAKKNKFKFSELTCTSHTSSGWITDKKATVNSAGKKHKECTMCGKVIKTEKIKQLKCSAPKIKAVENTVSGVKISWGKVSGADKYKIYRSKKKSDGYDYIGATSKTVYTDKKAKSGTKYYYKVKAVNEAGDSVSSSAKSIRFLEAPVLKTPSSTKSGIKIVWSKVKGAEGYAIYRKTGSGNYSKLKTEKGVSNLSYVDKSAKKGKKYTYKVKAYYGETHSGFSNVKSVTDKY